MLHTCAFFKSSAGTLTLEDTPAVQDQTLAISASNHFLLPQDAKLKAIYAKGTTLTNARFNTPHLRMVSIPTIDPIDALAVSTSSSPPRLEVFPDGSEPVINAIDEFEIDMTTGVGASSNKAIAWLLFGNKSPVPVGPVYTLKATATITQVAGSWVNGNFTLDQGLPDGLYTVIGLDAFGAGLVAARLVFPNQWYRPGTLARNLVTDLPAPDFRAGRLGALGQFRQTAIPTLDVFADGAGAAQTIFIDVVRQPGSGGLPLPVPQ